VRRTREKKPNVIDTPDFSIELDGEPNQGVKKITLRHKRRPDVEMVVTVTKDGFEITDHEESPQRWETRVEKMPESDDAFTKLANELGGQGWKYASALPCLLSGNAGVVFVRLLCKPRGRPASERSEEIQEGDEMHEGQDLAGSGDGLFEDGVVMGEPLSVSPSGLPDLPDEQGESSDGESAFGACGIMGGF